MSKAIVKAQPAVPKLLEVEKVRDALARCVTIDEAKHYRDGAVLLQIFHRQQKASRDTMNDAGEIKLRAERKLGELLDRHRRQGLRDAGKGGNRKSPRQVDGVTATPPTLKAMGIEPNAAKRWQEAAKIPEKKFEAFIEKQRKDPRGEISAAGLRREAMPDVKRAERVAAVVAKVKERIAKAAAAGSPQPLGVFPVILADNPWEYEKGSTDPSREIDNQYETMAIDAICALEVGNVAHDDAILFLWYPPGMATEAVKVVTAWGFRERSGWVWEKPSIGPGYWGRLRHENVMICTRGSFPTPAPSDRFDSIFEAPRGKRHSEKPLDVHQRIEAMFPGMPKLEMFARQPRDGWTVLGYDVGTGDIRDSLRNAGALDPEAIPDQAELQELARKILTPGLSIVCPVCNVGVNTPCFKPPNQVLEHAHPRRIADEAAAQ